MLKKFSHLVVGAALFGAAHSASATSFYIVAHSDDVELFMARNAAADIASGSKVVFIVLTTGSFVRTSPGAQPIVVGAGIYPLIPPSQTSYYLTREAGHTAAVTAWYQQRYAVRGNDVNPAIIAGKSIARTQIGGVGSKVVMYHLRLVDGDEESQSGFTWFRNKSLAQPATRIAAVDSSATYNWIELKQTVNALIAQEQDGFDTWVNIPEYWEDGMTAPNYAHPDHLDHMTTGRLVSHALYDYAASLPSRCIRTIQWLGYPIQDLPENYTTAEKNYQNSVWFQYNQAQNGSGGPNTYDSGHAVWLARSYTSSKNGNGVTKFGPCLNE